MFLEVDNFIFVPGIFRYSPQPAHGIAIYIPPPKKMLPALAVVLLLLVVAFVKVPKTLDDYHTYQAAKEQAADGEIYLALSGMLEVAEAYPDSTEVAERAVTLAMESGYYDFAAYLLNEYMVGKQVSDTTYAKINRYADQLDLYYNSYDKIEEIGENMDPSLD